MKTFQNLSDKFSNWEAIAFTIISKILAGSNPRFSRSELMRFENLENARKLLMFFSHKKDPTSLENTLQRTIQNLRERGYIDFLGEGEYYLNPIGSEAVADLNPTLIKLWDDIKNLRIDQIEGAIKELDQKQQH